MSLGTLELQLMMIGVDQMKRDMDDVKGSIGSAMADVQKSIGFVKEAFVAMLGVGSVAAFAGMIKGSIEATAALHDMAIQTGASEAALGQFRALGAYTETSIDSITAAMGKLSKNLINGNEDAKGAGIAIKALGLDFDSIRQMKPEDQMIAIAGAMNQFADGTDKSAAAQALWGKEGAKLLPFIKDLGDATGELTEKLTEQEKELKKVQSAMADAFTDNLVQIRKESDAWKKDLATGMTPALYEASQAFLDVTNGAGGLKEEISNLSKDGTITSWSRTAITGVTYVMDAFSGLKAEIKTVGESLGYMAASAMLQFDGIARIAGQVIHGEFAAAADTYKSTTLAQQQMTESFQKTLDNTWGEQTLGSKLRERMADLQRTGFAMDENGKKALDVKKALDEAEAQRQKEAEAMKAQEAAARALNAELKRQEDQYDKLVAGMGDKAVALEAELAQGRKLTESQKMEIKLEQDLINGKFSMKDALLDEAIALINRVEAAEKSIAAQQREKKETEEATKAYADLIEKIQSSVKATTGQIDKLKEQLDTYGMTREELTRYTMQKDLDTAATWDQKAAWAEQNGLGADLVEQYKLQAQGLRDLAALKEQGIHVQAAKDAALEWAKTTKSISDGLSSAITDAFFNGRSVWDAFKNYLINSILDNAIKNALSSVIQGGINSMLGSLGINVASSAAGAGAGAGAAAGGGSMLSAAGSALGINSAGFTGTGLTGSLGIGASAGAGVTTGAVTGGGTGAAIGTDLGALGAESTAATSTAGASSAGLGALGTAAAAAAAVIVIGDMLKQSQRPFELVGTQAIPSLTDTLTRQQETESGWMSVPIHQIAAQKLRFTDDGSIMYQMMGDGIPIEAVNASALTQKYGIPAFAGGTDYFSGGLRLVGERGPELEATGPSRIYNAEQTASMLRSGGAGYDEVVAELRVMQTQLAQLHRETRRTADAVNGNAEAPMLTEIA